MQTSSVHSPISNTRISARRLGMLPMAKSRARVWGNKIRVLIEFAERLHGNQNGFRRRVEYSLLDKIDDPICKTWRKIHLKLKIAFGSLPTNRRYTWLVT